MARYEVDTTQLAPGFVLGSLAHGGVTAHGHLDLEASIPMSQDTIFRIDSLTKPIIAVALITLLEERGIDLEAPAANWLPELDNPRVLRGLSAELDNTEPARRQITVEDILTSRMGTGIVLAPPDSTPFQREVARQNLVGFGPPDPSNPLTADEWLARLGTLPLLARPGESWFYNASSIVQSVLISRLSGMSLGAYLKERVFAPLGMSDTYFSIPGDKLDRFTSAYAADLSLVDDRRDSPWAFPPAFEVSGGLLSTVPDFLKFVSMLHGRGRRLIGDDWFARMFCDHLTPGQRKAASVFLDGRGWGYGISVSAGQANANGGTVGWSGGTGVSWVSDFAEDRAVIVFSNRALDDSKIYAVHEALHRVGT